mmetsp:Transcript_117193/g.251995  ORF Transcript_117193/g.251995 Transcript_117193/m.251995 type:complete len:87 (-) Transcript_117193:86-346(-)
MLTLILNADLEQTKAFMTRLKYFPVAESLGGYESLCELPAIMTHASVPQEMRKELGIEDGLIRFSVGLEDGDDLLDDIRSSLELVK